MYNKDVKRNNDHKGFTLAELLVVVAIIAVLVAISIPVFTSQLHKARVATDWANLRLLYAEIQTEYITDGDWSYAKACKVSTDAKTITCGKSTTTLIEGSIQFDHDKNPTEHTYYYYYMCDNYLKESDYGGSHTIIISNEGVTAGVTSN